MQASQQSDNSLTQRMKMAFWFLDDNWISISKHNKIFKMYNPQHKKDQFMNRLFLPFALLVSAPLIAMQQEDGDTLLISAVRQNNLVAAREMLWELQNKDFYESRHQVEEQNKLGETALHVAAWLGNKEICTLLLERGAIPATRTNQWVTAYDYARAQGNTQILALFAKLRNCQNSYEDIRKKLRADEQTEPLTLTLP